MKRIAVTGGIACGKSLLTRYLAAAGIATIDADDVVHELIPPDERKRLAAVVFHDPVARKALEKRIHPLVKARIRAFQERQASFGQLGVAIIPLLFETHWDKEYDIICCVCSVREVQIDRMMTTRGYTRDEAEARLAAQMSVAEKAAKSHYVIENNGSVKELRQEAEKFVIWLKNSMCSPGQ